MIGPRLLFVLSKVARVVAYPIAMIKTRAPVGIFAKLADNKWAQRAFTVAGALELIDWSAWAYREADEHLAGGGLPGGASSGSPNHPMPQRTQQEYAAMAAAIGLDPAAPAAMDLSREQLMQALIATGHYNIYDLAGFFNAWEEYRDAMGYGAIPPSGGPPIPSSQYGQPPGGGDGAIITDLALITASRTIYRALGLPPDSLASFHEALKVFMGAESSTIRTIAELAKWND